MAAAELFISVALLCGTYQGNTEICVILTDKTQVRPRRECVLKAQDLAKQAKLGFTYLRIPSVSKEQLKCVPRDKVPSVPSEAPPAKEPTRWERIIKWFWDLFH